MPLAGSLLQFAQDYPTDVSVIINSDVVLTQSFVEAIAQVCTRTYYVPVKGASNERHLQVNSLFGDWFMTGARLDLKELPQQHDPSRSGFSDTEFTEYARNHGTLHSVGGVDYFAWNNQVCYSNGAICSNVQTLISNLGLQRAGQRTKLIHGVMPPFIRGKSKFDNWIVHEVIQAGYRETVDATEAAVVVHISHGYKSADSNVQVNVQFLGLNSIFPPLNYMITAGRFKCY